MQEPLISVIVPIYKVEAYLDKCVASIVDQSYRNLEIILVDDGSPDGCPVLCDRWKEKDERITVIHKPNGGLSDARNAGIDISRGDYIFFVDSDDYIDRDMCKKLLSACLVEKADLAICNYLYVGEHLKPEFIKMNASMPIRKECITGRAVLEEKMLATQSWYWVVAWTKLYKKEIFEELRFPKGKQHEDEFIFHQVFMKCRKVACIPDALYFYVQRSDSIMNVNYRVQNMDACEAYFERADAFMKANYNGRGTYHCCYEGITRMNLMYRYGQEKEPAFRDRYRQLLSQYRNLGLWRLLKNTDNFKHRFLVALAYFNPYLVRLLRGKK